MELEKEMLLNETVGEPTIAEGGKPRRLKYFAKFQRCDAAYFWKHPYM